MTNAIYRHHVIVRSADAILFVERCKARRAVRSFDMPVSTSRLFELMRASVLGPALLYSALWLSGCASMMDARVEQRIAAEQ